MAERFELEQGNQLTISAGPVRFARGRWGRWWRLSIDYPDTREVILSPEEVEQIGRALLARARGDKPEDNR